MKLKMIGFFDELPHGLPEGGSLRAAIKAIASPHESAVIQYLRQGKVFIATPGFVDDVLNPSYTRICVPNIMTDGVWAWPNDLPYYVSKYHAKIEDDFIEHAARQQWNVPMLTQADLLNLQL